MARQQEGNRCGDDGENSNDDGKVDRSCRRGKGRNCRDDQGCKAKMEKAIKARNIGGGGGGGGGGDCAGNKLKDAVFCRKTG